MRLVGRGAPLLGPTTNILAGPEGEFKYVSVEDRGLRYEVYLPGKNESPPRPLTAAVELKVTSPPARAVATTGEPTPGRT